MAIFAQKFDHFCLYLPEALINVLKHGTNIKIFLNETTWFLFEVNRLFYFKVMIIYITHEV